MQTSSPLLPELSRNGPSYLLAELYTHEWGFNPRDFNRAPVVSGVNRKDKFNNNSLDADLDLVLNGNVKLFIPHPEWSESTYYVFDYTGNNPFDLRKISELSRPNIHLTNLRKFMYENLDNGTKDIIILIPDVIQTGFAHAFRIQNPRMLSEWQWNPVTDRKTRFSVLAAHAVGTYPWNISSTWPVPLDPPNIR
jgi:hypothetical protein